jgi:hydroxypyruvate isomerase
MFNLNETFEEVIRSMAERVFAEELKIAIEELSKVKAPEKEFYSIKEVSHILSISESGIKSRHKNGKIELIYDQNNITVHKTELDRYKKTLCRQMKNKPL